MANRNSCQDVVLSYVFDGISGLRTHVEANGVNQSLLTKARNELKDRGQDTSEVNALIEEMFPAGSGGGTRGRSSLKIGESRPYKVQSIRDKLDVEQEGFIRLPVGGCLDRVKGQHCIVEALEDEQGPYMMVRPCAPPQANAEQAEEPTAEESGEDVDSQF